jgi:hypothetical protein
MMKFVCIVFVFNSKYFSLMMTFLRSKRVALIEVYLVRVGCLFK